MGGSKPGAGHRRAVGLKLTARYEDGSFRSFFVAPTSVSSAIEGIPERDRAGVTSWEWMTLEWL